MKKRTIYLTLFLLLLIVGCCMYYFYFYNKNEEITPTTEPTTTIEQEEQAIVSCGNNQIDEGEDLQNCRKDFVWKSGDGICDKWEDYRYSGDCPEYIVDICGNGRCEPCIGENTNSCVSDCTGDNIITIKFGC